MFDVGRIFVALFSNIPKNIEVKKKAFKKKVREKSETSQKNNDWYQENRW